ncbi:MAG TPA: OB-fold domain-containing protein [Burkholderiaceae bacterium]|nr:OB-fold domain-containing protein [Burkholderiaceae bacterium]
MAEAKKPPPRINPTNRPFFEGCNEQRLMLQQCEAADCRRHVYFPRVCCPYCGSGDLEWRQASGSGTIVTYTIVHRPNHPSFFPEAPYYFIAVRLAEGPLMYSRLVEKPQSDLDLLGRQVSVTFVPHSDDQMLPYFRLT